MSNVKDHSLREQLSELLAFLRTQRPALTDILTPAANRAGIEDIPPPDEVITDIPEWPHDRGRPLATFVMGCGQGAWVKRLLQAAKDLDSQPPVIVVEPDRARMLMSLLKGDWDSVIEEPGLHFAVGGPTLKAVEDALHDYADPMLEFDHGVAIIPGEIGSHPEKVRTSFEKAAHASRTRFVQECTTQIAEKGTRPHLPHPPWKVASVASDSTTALHSLARSIVEAATREGHHAQRISSDHLRDPFLGSTHQRAILNAEPDVCVSFMQPGSTIAPWRKDYLSIVLVSSHPNLHPIDTMSWTDRDIVVITDPDFAQPFTDIGVPTHLKGLATDIPDLERIRAEDTPLCDVSLVANLSGARAVIPNISDEMLAYLERQGKIWAEKPTCDPKELLSDWAFGSHHPLLQHALAYEATLHRRVNAALAVSDAGLSLRIYGNSEWEKYIHGTSAEGLWFGPAEPQRQQPAMFHFAKVSINVNSFATPTMLNMRSLDIPAAQGLLLSDDRPELHERFAVGKEVLSFERTEEIPDIVRGIITNPELRNTMATAARERVRRDHSWDRWWNWAEAGLKSRLENH